jgi:hypothetical protein
MYIHYVNFNNHHILLNFNNHQCNINNFMQEHGLELQNLYVTVTECSHKTKTVEVTLFLK